MYDFQTNFTGFLEYLTHSREKIAYLQLNGKIEDFLVKEFCYFIYNESKGKYATVVNMGKTNKKEKRIDICVISGENLDLEQIQIEAMMEVKYFRNWHRFLPLNAKDNIRTIMKDFNKQIYKVDKNTHGWFKVNSNVSIVNAMAFASFVSYEQNDNKKEDYYTRILTTAKEIFANNIISKFSFHKVYEDTEIELFNKKIYITLRAGLWE